MIGSGWVNSCADELFTQGWVVCDADVFIPENVEGDIFFGELPALISFNEDIFVVPDEVDVALNFSSEDAFPADKVEAISQFVDKQTVIDNNRKSKVVVSAVQPKTLKF